MNRLALALLLVTSATAFAGGRKKPAPAPPPAPAPVPDPTPAPPPPPPIDTPWSQGVSADNQAKARALYEEGNTLFAQQAHAPALEKYKQAIALWEHPLVRFNMAVTEIHLDRILDAADDLEKALRFGATPFDAEHFQQAQDYKALIDGRVGYIEGSCEQPETHLLLDGKPWFDCPGKQKLRVIAGEHAIVGERKGYLTASQKIVVAGGKTASAKIQLVPLESAVVLKYPYRRWIPWTTAGIGAAVALGGLATWFIGKSDMQQFETDYAQQCANGCEPGLTDPTHRPLKEEMDSAELKGKIGIAMMGTGGAVMVVGVVLAILNRPERVLPNVEVAPKSGGAVASVGWHF